MAVKARLAAKVGEYEKNGETKGEYVRLGVIMSSQNGEFMLIDPTVSLAGVLMKQRAYNHSQGKQMRETVIVNIFSEERTQNKAPQQPSGDSFNDDIPF